jgi:hypothetical protein
MEVRLDLLQQPALLELLDHRLASGESVHATESLGNGIAERRVLVEDVDLLEIMTQPDLEVVGIVRRRHFHETRPELRIDELIRDDGDLALGQRQAHRLADQVLVPVVLRMNSHGGIAEHGLRPRRGHDDVARLVAYDRIALIVQGALDVLVLDFLVRQSRGATRTPVHDVVAAIDQALLVEPDEDLAHGLAGARIEREAGALPIGGTADRFQLIEDRPARLAYPFPDSLDERLATQVPATLPFSRQAALYHVLGRDSGVVGPGDPQSLSPLHTAPADQNVLDGVVETVTHMQLGGHVGRRHDDDVGLALAVGIGPEVAVLEPARVAGFFERLGVESCRQLAVSCLSLLHQIATFLCQRENSTQSVPGTAGALAFRLCKVSL